MEQAESNLDSLRVFTTEKWFVQLGMAARGIACCSKCGISDRTVMQVPAFKVPACLPSALCTNCAPNKVEQCGKLLNANAGEVAETYVGGKQEYGPHGLR